MSHDVPLAHSGSSASLATPAQPEAASSFSALALRVCGAFSAVATLPLSLSLPLSLVDSQLIGSCLVRVCVFAFTVLLAVLLRSHCLRQTQLV
jgi:hypothetical protein